MLKWCKIQSLLLYLLCHNLFIFSCLFCFQSHLIYIQSTSVNLMYSVLITFCEHVQSSVRRWESYQKLLIFEKKVKEINACHTIISYKEIKQTKILSIRKIFILVVMLYCKEQGGRLPCLEWKRTPIAGDNNRFQSQESLCTD